jgi:hypothetical protein
MSCYPNNSCNRNVLKSCSNTDVVVYTGENLTCTGVEYGDSLTVVLQKLDEKYCEILNLLDGVCPDVLPQGDECSYDVIDILNSNNPIPPTDLCFKIDN